MNAALALGDGRVLRYRAFPRPSAGDVTPLAVFCPDAADLAGWSAVCERLAEDFAVDLVPLPAGDDGREWAQRVVDDFERPGVVVGYAGAGGAAAAAVSGRRVAALVLVECAPESPDLALPTLVLRGRQSAQLTHEDAVVFFRRLPLGRLTELEDCASDPATGAPAALEAALRWFIAGPPGGDVAEFPADAWRSDSSFG